MPYFRLISGRQVQTPTFEYVSLTVCNPVISTLDPRGVVSAGEQETMRMIAFVVLGFAFPAAHAIADNNFTGKDAAYIDWGVKNCDVVSSEKEHKLAEQANANGGNQFIQQWTDESSKLAEAFKTQGKQASFCSDIKEWYGPLGSRISELINWKRDTPPEAKAKSSSSTSQTRGRKRSGQ
jgi:hypothetical protein